MVPMVGDTINTNTLSFGIGATKHKLNERCTDECIQKSIRHTSCDPILRERARIEMLNATLITDTDIAT